LDFGRDALADTLAHLDRAGIAHTGAGLDVDAARRPATLTAGGLRVALLGLSDHPADFTAGSGRPGIAFADLADGVPGWVGEAQSRAEADVRLVSPHWGPNMVTEPVRHVRAAAGELVAAGADLIAGHSAHVPHGVGMVGATPVLYDLGDFVDDYAVDPERRNDLGLLWLVELDAREVRRVEAVPLKLDFCRTRLAESGDAAWLHRRLAQACAALGTEAAGREGRVAVGLG
jgi:poly-gamma-glutamate synthesis protein (capsule biosynthesis protein)